MWIQGALSDLSIDPDKINKSSSKLLSKLKRVIACNEVDLDDSNDVFMFGWSLALACVEPCSRASYISCWRMMILTIYAQYGACRSHEVIYEMRTQQTEL